MQNDKVLQKRYRSTLIRLLLFAMAFLVGFYVTKNALLLYASIGVCFAGIATIAFYLYADYRIEKTKKEKQE